MRTLLFLTTVVLLAQTPWPPPGLRCPERTLVIFEHGPNWEKAAEFREPHLAYLLAQMKSGKVVSAGPVEGGQRAAMLFASKDWSDVEPILKDEPFTHEGVIRISEHVVWSACEVEK
jgi:uncharacterized protein YciI